MDELGSEYQESILQRKKDLLKEHLLPKDHFSFTSSQYNDILKQVADKIAKFSIESQEDQNGFEDRFLDAVEIINDIKLAVTKTDENESEDSKSNDSTDTDQDHEIWSHGNIQSALRQGYESEHSKEVDKEWMTAQAGKYLQRPWMENTLLEWIMVDSLMFWEITSYGEIVKRNTPTSLFSLNENYITAKGNVDEMEKLDLKDSFKVLGFKLLAFFIAPILIAIYTYKEYSKEWTIIGSAIYVCLLFLYFILRSIFGFFTRDYRKQKVVVRNKELELVDDMANAYIKIEHGIISPTYMRDRLYESSKLGAVWPHAIFMILDHAIERNPAVWYVPDPWKYEN